MVSKALVPLLLTPALAVPAPAPDPLLILITSVSSVNVVPNSDNSNETVPACISIADQYDAKMSKNGFEEFFSFPAKTVEECLTSVPLDVDMNLRAIDEIREATKGCHYNILGEDAEELFGWFEANLRKNTWDNQISFVREFWSLLTKRLPLLQAHQPHILSAFDFRLGENESFAFVSDTVTSKPQIFMQRDLSYDAEFTPSAVTRIGDEDPIAFFSGKVMEFAGSNLDGAWTAMLRPRGYSSSVPPAMVYKERVPISFANGTTTEFPILAASNAILSGMRGYEGFTRLFHGTVDEQENSFVPPAQTVVNTVSMTPFKTLFGGLVNGFFVEEAPDVLAISFRDLRWVENDEDFKEKLETGLQEIVAAGKADGRTKLVIDFRSAGIDELDTVYTAADNLIERIWEVEETHSIGDKVKDAIKGVESALPSWLKKLFGHKDEEENDDKKEETPVADPSSKFWNPKDVVLLSEGNASAGEGRLIMELMDRGALGMGVGGLPETNSMSLINGCEGMMEATFSNFHLPYSRRMYVDNWETYREVAKKAWPEIQTKSETFDDALKL